MYVFLSSPRQCGRVPQIRSGPLSAILWGIDPLFGKDLETNETTAVAMQRRDEQASALLETVLCNPLLSSCNTWTNPTTGVFSMWSMPRSYIEDNWGNPVSSQMKVSLWNGRQRECCQLSVVSWELSSAREAVKRESGRVKLKNLHC
jgi:hypothetical protein